MTSENDGNSLNKGSSKSVTNKVEIKSILSEVKADSTTKAERKVTSESDVNKVEVQSIRYVTCKDERKNTLSQVNAYSMSKVGSSLMQNNKQVLNKEESNKNNNWHQKLKLESESETEVFDEGTVSYFWQAHTISVLALGISILLYVAFYETPSEDTKYNVKRGVVAAACAFLAFGITQARDGPIVRPHPAIWRLLLCISLLYELVLVFFLFQTAPDARKFFLYIDPDLNKVIQYKDYSNSCAIWDPGHHEGPFHNIYDKMDLFVAAHFFGWFWKAIVFRDVYITVFLSFMFEILEYTCEHQLPNFQECWWDHWILDFVVCNGLGIYFGLKCIKYLTMKEYRWCNLWNIHTYKGKMKRVVGQFTPYSWVKFKWKASQNLYRWLFISFLAFMSLLAELNTFYLKYVLWIPAEHYLVFVRLLLYGMWAFVAVRETYDYVGGKSKAFGQQAWVISAIIFTELMLVCRFGHEIITIPFPSYIKYLWLAGVFFYIFLTLWKFQLKFPKLRHWGRQQAHIFEGGGADSPVINNYDTDSVSDSEDQLS